MGQTTSSSLLSRHDALSRASKKPYLLELVSRGKSEIHMASADEVVGGWRKSQLFTKEKKLPLSSFSLLPPKSQKEKRKPEPAREKHGYPKRKKYPKVSGNMFAMRRSAVVLCIPLVPRSGFSNDLEPLRKKIPRA